MHTAKVINMSTKQKHRGVNAGSFKPIADLPGRYMEIDKSVLNVDHAYQRNNIDKKNVDKIAIGFSWSKLGVILVMRRFDGSYWVFDGQHRKLAADLRPDISTLPCMVYDAAVIDQEAKAFLGVNIDRKSVGKMDLFKSKLATNDPMSVKIKALAAANGLRIAAGRTPGTIECIAAIEEMARVNFDALEKIFPVVAEVYAGKTIKHQVFRGFFYLFLKPGGEVLVEPQFAKRAAQKGSALFEAAIEEKKALVKSKSMDVLAVAVMDVINKGLRESNKIKVNFI